MLTSGTRHFRRSPQGATRCTILGDSHSGASGRTPTATETDLDGDRVGHGRLSFCLAGMSQQEIVDSNFSVNWLKERFEELNDNALKAVSTDGIEVVLTVAANCQNSGLLEQRQMMADGRLALIQTLTEFRNVEFSFIQQVENDSQTVGVRKHFAEMSQLGTKLGGGFQFKIGGFWCRISMIERSNHNSLQFGTC